MVLADNCPPRTRSRALWPTEPHFAEGIFWVQSGPLELNWLKLQCSSGAGLAVVAAAQWEGSLRQELSPCRVVLLDVPCECFGEGNYLTNSASLSVGRLQFCNLFTPALSAKLSPIFSLLIEHQQCTLWVSAILLFLILLWVRRVLGSQFPLRPLRLPSSTLTFWWTCSNSH